MAMTVEERPIPGLSIYGLEPKQYVVAGQARPLDYGEVIGMVALRRAEALESESIALSKAVRMRFRRIDELSEALRLISVAIANEKKLTENVPFPDAGKVTEILRRHGVNVSVALANQMNKGDLYKVQANVQFALDKESTQVQQDVTSVRYITGNRDNAMRAASSLQKKVYDGIGNTVGKMGV